MVFWIRGELIVVEDVPAGVCPKCGEKVVKTDVGRWIARLLENSERIAKAPRISVPSIKFDVEETIVTYPSLLQGRKGSTVFTIRACFKKISVYNYVGKKFCRS